MKTSLRSASTLLLAACVAGPMLHAAVLSNRLSRNAAATEPQDMRQGVSPRVRHSAALGHLSGDTRLETMSLVLAPSGEQTAALDQLLADQQNPASPRYHQWLTPEQFGAQFGVSDRDLQVLQNWLTNQGLQVLDVARSRNRITFSGTSATVEAAFHTELDRYSRDGQKFFENSTAPQIPAALQNVVSAITGLSSFRPEPRFHKVVAEAVQRPLANSTTGTSHYIAPYDFRQIYNASGLFNSGYTGTGIRIAVLGQSSVDTQQLAYFQQLIGQTVKAPTIVLIPNTGVSAARPGGDQLESEADLEYASGVAPGATVSFYYSGNATNSSVADALNYAITNNVAPILSYSYGGCETENPTSSLLGEESYLRQANAQGQTLLVASGDSGAAGCDLAGDATSYDGLQVGYPASSAYVTAIGGTSLNDATGTYWAGSNNSQYGSALGHIPETTWNETYNSAGTLVGLSATGGGFSRFFGKPNWQTGNGVPADGARDIPDISFSAAGHDAYLICTSDSTFVSGTSTGKCTSTAFGIGRVGGTSLPTPAFAGALAMVLNANGRTALGNINPLLYSLAGSTPSLFHDTTTGNNNEPCVAGTLGCTNGTLGYSAAVGYDLATGLGSLDIGGFSGSLKSVVATTAKVPTISLANLSGAASTIQGTLSVSGNNNTAAATGTVSISVDGGTPQVFTLGTNQTGTFSIPGTFTAGTHTLTATYSGDANYSAARATATVTVVTTTGGLTLAATPATLTINSSTAHSGSWTLTTTSTNGFSGIVSYSLTAATGSSKPSSGCFIGNTIEAGIAGNASVSTTITYSYSAADCQSAAVIRAFGNTAPAISGPVKPGAPSSTGMPLLAIGFTGLLGSAFLRRRRAWVTGLLAFAAMAGTVGLSGCGSGSTPLSTTTTGGGSTISAAPKGTYNLVFGVGPYLSTTTAATTNVTLVIQ